MAALVSVAAPRALTLRQNRPAIFPALSPPPPRRIPNLYVFVAEWPQLLRLAGCQFHALQCTLSGCRRYVENLSSIRRPAWTRLLALAFGQFRVFASLQLDNPNLRAPVSVRGKRNAASVRRPRRSRVARAPDTQLLDLSRSQIGRAHV